MEPSGIPEITAGAGVERETVAGAAPVVARRIVGGGDRVVERLADLGVGRRGRRDHRLGRQRGPIVMTSGAEPVPSALVAETFPE